MSATSSYPASYGDPAAVYHHHQYFPPAPIDAFPPSHPPASGSSGSWTYPADMPPNEYSPPPSAAPHGYLPPPSDYNVNVEMQSYTPLATAPWQLQHQLQQPLQQVGSSAAASNELAKPPKRGANKKERRRTMSINNAFAELRECIPNVPADTKLSKIKTLRLATSYIAYLSDILQCDDEAVPEFKAEIKKTDRNDERRKRELAMILEQEQKSHGRTGWPQHVWALELKQ